MRKIIVTEFMTLDGVVDSPNEWSFPFWGDESAAYKLEEILSTGALLLGRMTYMGFAAAWPTRKDDQGFADRMNSLPKYVVSATMKEALWKNTTIIATNVAEEVRKLKEQSGKDILVAGSTQLVAELLKHGLIDEIRLMISPVVTGRGKRLFPDGAPKTVFKLVQSKTFATGVVVLTYAPQRG